MSIAAEAAQWRQQAAEELERARADAEAKAQAARYIDKKAAAAVNRKTLTSYAFLPNYRNYWREAGYEEEMRDVEKAIDEKDFDRVPDCLSDRWLSDTTLFGTSTEVRDGIEAWFDSGIKTPIIVPSSATGGQMQALDEFLEIWS